MNSKRINGALLQPNNQPPTHQGRQIVFDILLIVYSKWDRRPVNGERASGRTRATGNTFIPHEHTANVLSPLPLKDRICQQLFYIAPFLFHSLFGLCPFSWCCMWRCGQGVIQSYSTTVPQLHWKCLKLFSSSSSRSHRTTLPWMATKIATSSSSLVRL